jgi:hypothetical protein
MRRGGAHPSSLAASLPATALLHEFLYLRVETVAAFLAEREVLLLQAVTAEREGPHARAGRDGNLRLVATAEVAVTFCEIDCMR